MKDLYNRLKVTKVIAPNDAAADATDQVGAIIDTQGYDSLLFVLQTGTLADVGAVFSVLIEDGDASNVSDAAAIAAAQLQFDATSGAVLDATPETGMQVAFDQANDATVAKIGVLASKRYVRLTISPVGNSTSSDPLAVLAIQGHARHQPAGATQTP